MKKRKRLAGIFLIIAALIVMQIPLPEVNAAASASDFKIDGVTLTKYSGTSETVTIPDSVEIIGESAFSQNTTIRQIKFSNSVKSIEAYAFWGCDNLETVQLGGGLSGIDDYAFANCKGLKSVTIPSNVTYIGIGAFRDCVNLTNVNIPTSVRSIHDTAFDGCYKLIIQAAAGSYASEFAAKFYERQKEMPEYEDIDKYDSDDQKNQTGNDSNSGIDTNQNTGDHSDEKGEKDDSDRNDIPQNSGTVLASSWVVGNEAVIFIDSFSSNVYSGNDTPVYPEIQPAEQDSSDDNQYQNTMIQDGSSYPKYAVVNGKIIADQAFYRNYTLENVTIPSGIVEIGEFAYARSTLKSMVAKDGVRQIDYGAFYHCDDLTSVRLPSTIENIAPKAFEHTAYVDSFLDGDSANGDYLISGNSLIAYRGNASKLIIPEGVKLIAGEAFKGHGEIEEIVFPESLLVIGEGAFENCTGIKDISLGNSVTDIKDRAFSNCNLKSVTLPISVKKLGMYAFDDNVVVSATSNITRTHEVSAERLSNESYRRTYDNGNQPGVTVVGMEDVTARLEGAARSYTLTIRENKDTVEFLKVYRETAGKEFPAACPIYEMEFTDNSQIPITRLGRQMLYVTIPLDESFEGVKASVVTLDRNGQLESVRSERVVVGGKDCIRIITNHLSHFGILKGDEELGENDVIQISTEFKSGAAAPGLSAQTFPYNRIKLALAGILLLFGVVLIFHSTKYFVK